MIVCVVCYMYFSAFDLARKMILKGTLELVSQPSYDLKPHFKSIE